MANKVLLKKSSVASRVPSVGDLDYGELALNYADGKLYFKNSSNAIQSIGRTSYTRITTTTTASVGANYIADTSAGTFTVTLPASPATGDSVVIADGADFGVNALTVARNGSTIEGITDDLSLNISGVSVTLVYDGTTWEVYTQVGAQGGSEVTLAGVQTLSNKTLTAPTITAPTITGGIALTYNPGSATGYALTVSTKDTQGGIGYADFLKVTNTTTGATNPNKSFRLNSAGFLEIINSAYTASLMLLSDSGQMSTPLPYQVAGKQAVNGPTFSAYRTSAQSIATDVQTTVAYDVEEYDVGSCYNNSTYRFTPNVEGYYSFCAGVRFDGGIGTGERMITLWKNGAEYKRAYNTKGSAAVGDSWMQMELSCQAYANGSTDYFEIRTQHGAGANRNTTAGTQFTYFQGCMIRGA